MFEEFSVRFALWRRSRPAAVHAYLGRRSYTRPPWSPAVGVIRVGAVQMLPRVVRRAEEFADHAYELTWQAVQEGAELVVFPDHVTLPLLALVPGLSDALAGQESLEQAMAQFGATDGAEDEGELGIADVVAVATPAIRRIYTATFSTLARRFGIHIAAGSTMLAERDGRVMSVSHLYGPHGRLVHEQVKTHLTPLERRWGLGAADALRTVDCALGRVALAGTMDATYFEPFRLLADQGADVVLLSHADTARPQPWRALRGLWARSQESCLYGVQGALVGRAFGLRFSGPAAVYAPLDLTPAGDGMLATAYGNEEDEVVMADLDLGALHRLREQRGETRNTRIIGHYLPELYTRPWPWPGEAAVGRPAPLPLLPLSPLPPSGSEEV